jgi:hypothetical protein
MFTRRVIMNIKPGSAAKAGRIFESEAEAVAAFAKPILGAKGQLLSYEYARYETHS